MKLLAPAVPKEIADRLQWFKKPIARKLTKNKGVEFGFELKGLLANIKQAPDLFWGIHLPDSFTTDWYYHPERRKKIIGEIQRIARLKPNYAVIHGIHLLWQPPSHKYIHRYFNTSDAKEFQKLLKDNIRFINEIKNLLPVKFENCELALAYLKNGTFRPQTHLDSGIGRLDDLLYLKKKTGIDLLLDLEHLAITLNLLNRKKNYSNLPVEKIEKPTADDKRLKAIFGFWLKKYFIPYVDKKIQLEDALKKYPSKYYHLVGSFQDVVPGKRVLSHGPINLNNKTFRKYLKIVLAQKPEVLVMETANSTLNKAWDYLRPNETEISFNNLCEILLEDL